MKKLLLVGLLGFSNLIATACSSDQPTAETVIDNYLASEYISERGIFAEPIHVASYCNFVGKKVLNVERDNFTIRDTYGTELGHPRSHGVGMTLYSNIGRYMLECKSPAPISKEEFIRIKSIIGRNPTLHEILYREYEDCDRQVNYTWKQIASLGEQCITLIDNYKTLDYPMFVEDLFPLE